jgi:hypothetical protein
MFHFTFSSFIREEEREGTHIMHVSATPSNCKGCSKLLFQLTKNNTLERRRDKCYEYLEDLSQPSNLLGSG